jgi:hypothetical protein
MTACVIMHNIIIEDEQDDNLYNQGWDFQGELIKPKAGRTMFLEFLHVHHEIHDQATHIQFQITWLSICEIM